MLEPDLGELGERLSRLRGDIGVINLLLEPDLRVLEPDLVETGETAKLVFLGRLLGILILANSSLSVSPSPSPLLSLYLRLPITVFPRLTFTVLKFGPNCSRSHAIFALPGLAGEGRFRDCVVRLGLSLLCRNHPNNEENKLGRSPLEKNDPILLPPHLFPPENP